MKEESSYKRREADFSFSYEIISFCDSAHFRARRYHVTYICHGERVGKTLCEKWSPFENVSDPITVAHEVCTWSPSSIDGWDENSIWAVVSLYHVYPWEMFVFARNKFRRRKRRMSNTTPIYRQHAPPFFLPTPLAPFSRGGVRNIPRPFGYYVELPLSLTLLGDFKDSKL